MKKRELHIRILSVVMLWVFSIALTPWSAFHNHHEQSDVYCAAASKVCMHKHHVGSESHNCLVCTAHFEKDYVEASVLSTSWINSIPVFEKEILCAASYVAVISTALRGPPVV